MKQHVRMGNIQIILKTTLSILAIIFSFSIQSQITISFSVDMTGKPIGPGGVHIAGQFASIGSTTITEDWQPGAEGSALTLLGDHIYGIDVVFPPSAYGIEFQFQFVRDSVWTNMFGDMSEGNAGGTFLNATCGAPDGLGGFNRLITITNCNSTYDAVWDHCASLNSILLTWYQDNDLDGYGNALISTVACAAPAGYVADATDCDDTHNTVFPGAPELCDGLDNNCNGLTDDGWPMATVTPSGTVSICKGDILTLTANDGIDLSYQWFKNGTLIPGATAITYNVTKAGNYSVRVTKAGGCIATSPSTTVNVNDKPNASISAPLGTSLCTTVKLKAVYSADYSYQWYLGAAPIAGATSNIYIVPSPGNYRCKVTNTISGCYKYSSIITVTACKDESISGGDELKIYPNPCHGSFQIELGNNIDQLAYLTIYNLNGDVVMESILNSDATPASRFSVELRIPAGLYLVKIVSGEIEFTRQLIIE